MCIYIQEEAGLGIHFIDPNLEALPKFLSKVLWYVHVSLRCSVVQFRLVSS